LVTLLLHIDGEPDGRTKFGKAVKSTWSAVHKNFPLPSDWQGPKVAAEFVQAESLRLGCQTPAALAMALVDRSGTDLGVLAFEVEKIVMLAKLAGVTVIEPKHVRGGMAPIAEASAVAVTEALSDRNTKKLVKALQALHKTSKEDPTMRVARLVGTAATRWLQALYLDSLPPKAAAEELGVNPWHFETNILPAAQRWGKAGTISLITDLAASERALLNGACDPWIALCSRLVAACQSSTGRSGR
jgi:DNA polymerase III delta subunit